MRRPTWKAYYKIGSGLAGSLEAIRTYEEIGNILGVPRQKAYQETMVALGKLAYGLKKNLSRRVI